MLKHNLLACLVGMLPFPVLAQTVTRFEQDDPRITYTGTWYPNSNPLESGGTARLANLKGSQAIVIFNGTGITWIGASDYYSGECYLTLDGLPTSVDTSNSSAPTLYQQPLFSIHTLTPGLHRMTIEVTHSHDGSTNQSWIWVDAFDIDNGSLAGGSPAAGPGLVQQTDVAANYSGHWFQNTGAIYSGGSIDSAVDAGARVDLTFNGTAVSWIGYRDEWSGLAQVLLDGQLQATVDTYLTPSKAQTTTYSLTGLAPGTHVLSIVATGNHDAASGGSWVWVDGFQISAAASSAPPVPATLTPAVSSGSSQVLTLTYNAPSGLQTLNVLNVLINSFLDGRQACYLAYSQSSNVLYVVADDGDPTQISGKVMDGTGAVSNSQCTVDLTGSLAAGNGNTFTLTLALEFSASFGGNKVVYAASSDLSGTNSGWQTMGAVGVPPLPSTFPNPIGMNPSSGNTLTQTVTFSFQDQSAATNLQTVWALINTALDGRGSCYVAYYRPGNQLLLLPDSGDASATINIVLSGANSVSNSQCTISAEGASVNTTGNTLSVTLPITFKTGFAGFKGVWLAASTMSGQTSAWQALGAEAVPGQ